MNRAPWRVLSRSFAWKSFGFVAALAGCDQAASGSLELASSRQAMMDDDEGLHCGNCVGGECAELHCFEDWTQGGGQGSPYDGPGCGNAPSCDSGQGGWGGGEHEPSTEECNEYFYSECKSYQNTSCRYRPERPPRTDGFIVADMIFGGALSELDRLYPQPDPYHSTAQCNECKTDWVYDVAQCMRGWECGGTMPGWAMEAQANDIFGDCNQARPSSYLLVSPPASPSASPNDFAAWSGREGMALLSGDFDGNGHVDLALAGAPGFSSIPVAFGGAATVSVTNHANGAFATWAASSGAQVLAGDFNGDGRTDLAVTGAAGLSTVVVAVSNGDGTFTLQYRGVGAFAEWAAAAGVSAVAGDFNADGLDDIALTGGADWNTVPVATASATGFSITNHAAGAFASAARGAQAVVADLSGDGRDDLALLPASGGAIPVATSLGGGTFSFTSHSAGSFAGWAREPGVRLVVGDFSGDGRVDLALTGAAGWTTVPVATSLGGGAFAVTNHALAEFPQWSADPSTLVVSGDFNGDGRVDLAARARAWAAPRFVYATGSGGFTDRARNTAIVDHVLTDTLSAADATPQTSPRADLVVDVPTKVKALDGAPEKEKPLRGRARLGD